VYFAYQYAAVCVCGSIARVYFNKCKARDIVKVGSDALKMG
jgi:hypothetical protein